MRAVVIDQLRTLPTVREVPDPVCPAHGAVVRVEATGVCRSDWHAWMGHDEVHLPHVPGHELAGTVVEVGRDVRARRVGERVTVPFVCACGQCPACASGEHQVCERQTQPGFTGWGSFAELVALDHADVNLVPLPDDVSAVAAASLGCRFATAYRALTAHGRVRVGDRVAVHGCGGVGLSAVMIARALGARVVATDVSPEALALARELGAEATVLVPRGAEDEGPDREHPDHDHTGEHRPDADRPDHDAVARWVAEQVMAATDGGAHVSLDALGHPATARASVLGLRRRGRHVQVGLLLGEHASPPLPMDRVVAWELEIYGSHGMAAHEYPAMLALVAAGRVDPARLVGRTCTLDEAGAALAEMRGPGMTVVVP